MLFILWRRMSIQNFMVTRASFASSSEVWTSTIPNGRSYDDVIWMKFHENIVTGSKLIRGYMDRRNGDIISLIFNSKESSLQSIFHHKLKITILLWNWRVWRRTCPCWGLVGYNTVWTSALNIEAVSSSETLVSTYKCTDITTQKANIDN
jgi:hypothetical protein